MTLRHVFLIFFVLSTILTACGSPPAAVPTEGTLQTETSAVYGTNTKYTEASILAEKVTAGELPPLEERLPESPFVVGPGVYLTEANLPDWSTGHYGGTLRMIHPSPGWSADVYVMLDEPFLTAPKISDQGIQCNICETFLVSEDNKSFTFILRKGLRWSDGVPVTTEDVRFAWEDIRQNEQLYPQFPNIFRTGFTDAGSPGVLEIIDDYTFKIFFDGPYGAFLRALTIEGWSGYTQLIEPAHFLKQFHINYTSLEELKPLLDEQNLTDEWWQVFSAKRCQYWDMPNPKCVGYPALNPWIGKETGSPDLLHYQRNPYYFKVDSIGQQLPYIDGITSTLVSDLESSQIKIISGEVDITRQAAALVKIPLYKENEAKAGYRIVILNNHVDPTGLFLNQTFDEPNWREVSQDIRFRQAVSLAINRQELIDTVYYGYASLPLKTMGEVFSQYDVDRANRLLDEVGLTKIEVDDYRMYPDGNVVEILLEYTAAAPDLTPAAELVSQHLNEIGIKVTLKQIEGALWFGKWDANEIQAAVLWSHDLGWGNDISSGSVDRAGRLWNVWVISGGKMGEKPPAWAMEAFDRDARKWAAVPDSDEYDKYVEESFTWSQTNLPYINFVEFAKTPIIVNKSLKNVPIDGYAIGAIFSVVQMYFDDP